MDGWNPLFSFRNIEHLQLCAFHMLHLLHGGVNHLVLMAMAPHSSTLAWKVPWAEEPGRLQSMGSWRVGQNWVTSLSCLREGNGNPLQCSCLENPRDGEPGGLPSMGLHSRIPLKRLSSSSRAPMNISVMKVLSIHLGITSKCSLLPATVPSRNKHSLKGKSSNS